MRIIIIFKSDVVEQGAAKILFSPPSKSKRIVDANKRM